MNHFNEMSKEWDSPEKITQNAMYAEKIKQHLNFTPKTILEVGCGTGLLGQQFVNEKNTLLGVDTSEGMLEVFNKKFADNIRVQSKLINLEEQNLNEQFDLILTSMAFHHLINPAQMVLKLKKNLSPGGVLAIIDLDKEDGSFHPDSKKMGVHHFGFSEEQNIAWGLEFKNVKREIINVIYKNESEYPVFLALYFN
jgi:2-polyprenyl-3-methyl-5-hydroxy-6-metoxy-1,4-benzoquinol methylase